MKRSADSAFARDDVEPRASITFTNRDRRFFIDLRTYERAIDDPVDKPADDPGDFNLIAINDTHHIQTCKDGTRYRATAHTFTHDHHDPDDLDDIQNAASGRATPLGLLRMIYV